MYFWISLPFFFCLKKTGSSLMNIYLTKGAMNIQSVSNNCSAMNPPDVDQWIICALWQLCPGCLSKHSNLRQFCFLVVSIKCDCGLDVSQLLKKMWSTKEINYTVQCKKSLWWGEIGLKFSQLMAIGGRLFQLASGQMNLSTKVDR